MAETTEDLVFVVRFGPLYPPIAQQLAAQGMEVANADGFEKARQSITLLSFRGYLTEGVATGAKAKLMADLQKKVRRLSAALTHPEA